MVGHRSAASDAAVRRVSGPLSNQPRRASAWRSPWSSALAAACCSAPRRRCSSAASIHSRRCEADRSHPAAAPIRDGLMALQCGLALLVLVVAGLFFQSFVETRETDPGFRTEGLLLATYDLSGTVTTDEYPRQFATAAARSAAAGAGGGIGGARQRDAARHPRAADAGLHARRTRARPRRNRNGAEQHRLARLLHDDGHRDGRRETTLPTWRSPRCRRR